MKAIHLLAGLGTLLLAGCSGCEETKAPVDIPKPNSVTTPVTASSAQPGASASGAAATDDSPRVPNLYLKPPQR